MAKIRVRKKCLLCTVEHEVEMEEEIYYNWLYYQSMTVLPSNLSEVKINFCGKCLGRVLPKRKEI